MAFDMTTPVQGAEKPPVPQETLNTPLDVEKTEVDGVGVAEAEKVPTAVTYSAPEQAKPSVKIEHSAQSETREEKTPLRKQIESILADNSITAIYKGLPAERQEIFQKTGEKLAEDIDHMMNANKMNEYKILAGIEKWLGIVPKVDKYYLQQEAKTMLDRVVALFEEQREIYLK